MLIMYCQQKMVLSPKRLSPPPGALYESDGASLPDSSRAQIREAVLRRLAADEDPAVVAAALEHCGAGVVVGELSPREAVNTLLACLDRVGGMLTVSTSCSVPFLTICFLL